MTEFHRENIHEELSMQNLTDTVQNVFIMMTYSYHVLDLVSDLTPQRSLDDNVVVLTNILYQLCKR